MSLVGASSTIAASRPMPAITANACSLDLTRGRPPAGRAPGPAARPRSVSVGTPRFVASRLPVPPGRIASAVSLPDRPVDAGADRAVAAGDEHDAAPSSTACFAWPVPGSSAVVSSHAGSGQPASASCSVMLRAELVETLDAVRVDDHRRASAGRASRCSAARLGRRVWGVVTSASMSRGSPTGHSGASRASEAVQHAASQRVALARSSGSRSRRRGPGSCRAARITACERWLVAAVNETISVEPDLVEADRAAPRARPPSRSRGPTPSAAAASRPRSATGPTTAAPGP